MKEVLMTVGGPLASALAAWLAAWYTFRGAKESSTQAAYQLVFDTLQEDNKSLREEMAKVKLLFEQAEVRHRAEIQVAQERYLESNRNISNLREEITKTKIMFEQAESRHEDELKTYDERYEKAREEVVLLKKKIAALSKNN